MLLLVGAYLMLKNSMFARIPWQFVELFGSVVQSSSLAVTTCPQPSTVSTLAEEIFEVCYPELLINCMFAFVPLRL